MLNRLSISNYALIEDLSVAFEPGFNIVTGETGAGKSVILGALALILGARADFSVLRNPDRKCIIEGTFCVDHKGLETFFLKNDLDFDPVSIIRREISSSGKSRAFVNDTPVTLQQLHDLALRLIDIHSQHQNLELNTRQFQLQLVDTVGQNQTVLRNFQENYTNFHSLSQTLDNLRNRAAKSRADMDYFQFQFKQLEEAKLQPQEQTLLEEEQNALVHAEEIKVALEWLNEILQGDHFPVVPRVKEAVLRIEKIREFLKEAGEIKDRLSSVQIELNDLAREISVLSEKTAFNPRRLAEISERLDLIYSLQQKHQRNSVEGLLDLKNELESKITQLSSYDTEIHQLEKEIKMAGNQLENAAIALTGTRKKVFPAIERKVTEILRQLGIPHARFSVEHELNKQLSPTGADNIQFLFSANRDTTPAEISKIASGGEISRVMLALKTLISDSNMLSTIVFDEIDSGISGETALKMGHILKNLSKGIQVINITHLPQIAGKGDHHFLVEKQDDGSGTKITVKKLTPEKRLEELARMVGGDKPTESAKKAAKEMLES
jgi:DNA repair protein RecN (Recombination protein N)